MKKIDLFMSLYSAADEAGKAEISAAMDALNNTFRALIFATPAYIQNGSRPGADIFDPAREALETLRRHADAQGVDFPMPPDERSFRKFVVDYGREVLLD